MANIPKGFKSLPLPIAQLSLAAVLKCGQSFRWSSIPLAAGVKQEEEPENAYPSHEYRLALRDRVVCLRQDKDTLFYRAAFPDVPLSEDQSAKRDKETLEWLRDYFQLDVDLVKLYSDWAERDVVFKETALRFSGIRILRQDPFENTISFICSSNNHINRIGKMVQSLCTEYGPLACSLPLPEDSEETSRDAIAYYGFPTPDKLTDESVSTRLRELGFGYRAEYVQRTAQMLCDEHEDPESYLVGLRKLSVEEARAELLKLCGVGPKVADCILLMSLDKRNVVPVDTHVHQIALKYYGLRGTPQGKGGKVPMTPKIYEAVCTKLVETWGDYAGWAHSVLFTADLRSFANYGLASPDSTPSKPETPATSVPPTPTESDADYFGETPTKKRRSRTASAPRLKRVKTE